MDKRSISQSDGRSTVSRRRFLQLLLAAVLSGCSPIPLLSPGPTQSEPTDRPTETPESTETQSPTSTPAPSPTPTPPSTPSTPPTATPTSTSVPTLIPGQHPYPHLMAPEGKSRVVQVRYTNVWEGERLDPSAVRRMVDGAITSLTEVSDPVEAWASLFHPDERIAIKVNTIASAGYWTHVELAMAVADCLIDAGVPGEQIVIFDRDSWELEHAGFPVEGAENGVRCYGTDGGYTSGWEIVGRSVELSQILLDCDALINIPVLKLHSTSGMSFALKNHYGTLSQPGSFHRGIAQALPELNLLEPIRDRTRLIVGDALSVIATTNWHQAEVYDSLLMSFDPLAHDAVGLDILDRVCEERLGRVSGMARPRATEWLEYGEEIGLGTGDVDLIEWLTVDL